MKVENNKEIRIMKKKILKITLSIVLILILVVGIGLTYLVGAAGGGGPFDFVWKNKLKKIQSGKYRTVRKQPSSRKANLLPRIICNLRSVLNGRFFCRLYLLQKWL